MTKYKQSYVVVMDSGKVVMWTGYGVDNHEGEALAKQYAEKEHSGNVWDIANRPVRSN